MSNPLVKVRGLHKSFGDLEVLRGIDMDISSGEVVVVFGRSGSGKSTFLRCLNFLEEPTQGVIQVAGIEVDAGLPTRHRRKDIRRLRSQCGMVFQQFNLFPHMTVLDNVMEGPLRVKSRSSAEVRTHAMELLNDVGMADKAGEHPIRLSGGQQQRVAIARALAMRPAVMLFDEPTSALDPELIHEVLAVMRRLAESHETTMIVVTHEMGFAREVATRMCFFHDGVVLEEGTPDQMFARAQQPETRRFLEAVI
ncbi:MAG: amino acid ABC transporter ATP-binding protein [Candidatus Nanopelagicales bacterium]|jgi:ABC-type polar amino acid transport system ATPase subunit|nr:amino acid ABC transporter ATP-binding protein [Candidatus Nanopelagicales bacterium]MDP4715949.1 amino acid ABC transporter ATP-binding protein [Candidatus Nanopelagicales bacterium]MDP4907310.1 amino acid ABC transporter ATP-binding protein [Candidatus Nanopelagicales bacterium]MDP4974670.1 amino acid ABC transporter ATP-binding protein [Candidatus Nanopelagicales bacterium]MDP5095609.1 amino acid ABC transporter ATP-binding protein [Candidatus Nanopelagicales bacterium]